MVIVVADNLQQWKQCSTHTNEKVMQLV